MIVQYFVRGTSMSDYFTEGDTVSVEMNPTEITHGDLVIIQHNEHRWLKEVIATPGDVFTVMNDTLYIDTVDGKVIMRTCKNKTLMEFSSSMGAFLPPDNYIVIGTSEKSFDSRNYGPILRNAIIGKVINV